MKDEIKNLISVRAAVETDHNFIYATWLRGLYYGNSFFKLSDKNEFMERYEHVIRNLLFRGSVETRVACLNDDPDAIIGYSLVEQYPNISVLHWVFVKPEWRRVGVASDLIPDSVSAVTHIVDSICQLKLKDKAKSEKYLSNYEMKLKNKKLTFKPFLL